MKRLVLVLLILQNYLFACSVCTTEVPQVIVDANITAKQNKTIFDISWKFHKEFVDDLTQYDLNENKIFEESEKLMIEDSLISYLKQFRYLTDIEYKHQKQLTQTKYIENIETISTKLSFNNNGMLFQYSFELPIVLKNSYKLYIGFNDDRGNFSFILKNILLHNYEHTYTLSKTLINSNIIFNDPNINQVIQSKSSQTINEKVIVQEKKQSYLKILGEKLNEIKNSLKEILRDIKENNSILSYIWLLLFSFLYGIVHAIGPGHGKSLVSSYFLNQNKSYLKAFSVSSLIGIVHTFSAFILTLVVYYSVSFIFNSTITNIEQITIKISASIIILIAFYLIWQKYKEKKTILKFTDNMAPLNILSQKVTHTQTLSCGCNACKTTGTDLGVILAAGIIPCPGTITIFLFTMSLEIYFVGFLSALFMSIGMSLIIFITAILSIKIRQSATQNKTIIKFMEYASLIFILLLGIVLLTVS